MNNKKNYKKGARRELIYILMSSGIITTNALHILSPEYNFRTLQQKLEEMIHEGIIEKKSFHKGKDTYSFYIFSRNIKFPKEIIESVPPKIVENYNSEREKIRRASSECSSRALREIQKAELMVFMYVTGFSSFADQKKKTKYYDSIKFKRYFKYSDDFDEKTDTALYTKVFGFVTNDYNNYSVYHVNKTIPSLSPGEASIVNSFDGYIANHYEDGFYKRLRGLIVIRDLNNLIPYVAIDDNNVEDRKRDEAITTYTKKYNDKVYVIPYNDYGKRHLRIMAMFKDSSLNRTRHSYSNIHSLCHTGTRL